MDAVALDTTLVNRVGVYRYTLLVEEADQGQLMLTQHLLQNNADVDARKEFGFGLNSVMCAAANGRLLAHLLFVKWVSRVSRKSKDWPFLKK
jgi:hypothetical protein